MKWLHYKWHSVITFFSYRLFAINYKHLVSKNSDTFTYLMLLYNLGLVSAVQ